MGKEENFGKKINTKGFDKNPENINKTGANGKSVTKFLKELLNGKILQVDITLTDTQGKKQSIQASLKSKENLNQTLASMLIQKALKGDMSAIKEILDRTEGKPQQQIDHTSEGEKIQPTIIQLTPPKNE